MYFYNEHDEQGIKEPERRPVIHKILFECVCDDSKNMHCYQIGAIALKKGVGDAADKFHDLWSREHPSRVMRYMWNSSSDNTDVFVFLHHEKVVK
ncbi:MAG: hypothetical protein IJQ29_08065 [Synergistaceae bacterium]|nr:hypothetical protein [Synergistaceae bacterium]